VLATISRNVDVPPRTCCVMPAFEPGWDIVSCRCRCRLRRARSPASRPFFLVPPFAFPGHRLVAVVAAITMVVASTRARMHPCTYPRACAPAHAHALAWEGIKPNPFSFCSSTELSSPAFRRGVTLRGVVPPDGASARSFMSSHAHSHARTRGLSPTPAAPPSRFASVRRGRRAPTCACHPLSCLCF
jgi:hypothetical protein